MTAPLSLVDTHCHLDASRFDPDRSEVLARAAAAGVTAIVVPGIGPDQWEPLLALGRATPAVHVGLGIHPQLLPELEVAQDDEAMERLDGLLARGEAIAVGECGLDGPSAAGAPMERQLRVLRRHLELADRHQLPALVHCLHAHPALVELLKERPIPEAGLVLHSYSGGADLAKFYAARGCHFGFAGPVTFLEARKPLASLAAVPHDRLLLETDAPDQAPHPHRGSRCEPSQLHLIAGAAAKHLEMPVSELAEQTSENARRLFRRPLRADPR